MSDEERAGRRAAAYSERIDAALRFAAAAHGDQVRKGTNVPYVMHPFHVGLLLDRHGYAEDVVVAGILHDVLEDPHYEHDTVQHRLRADHPDLRGAPGGEAFRGAVVTYLREVFGGRVVDLVEHVTEQKTDAGGQRRPWRVRKEEQLAALVSAPDDVCAIKAADCLHNLTALARDLRAYGAGVLDRYNAGPHELLWYHTEIVTRVAPRLGDDGRLAGELRRVLAELTALVG